jgi:hypothetical protein
VLEKKKLQRTQVYLQAEAIELIQAQYPGLKSSEAIRAWIMARISDRPPPPDPAQLHIKDIAGNIKQRRSEK